MRNIQSPRIVYFGSRQSDQGQQRAEQQLHVSNKLNRQKSV